MHCKSISKSFQIVVNAFSNTDNAFNETAGGLELFKELLLSARPFSFIRFENKELSFKNLGKASSCLDATDGVAILIVLKSSSQVTHTFDKDNY